MATSITKELTPEALKIYDRQRFIGLDVQRRLLNSLILLHPLNGVITELAKNLVLCGCNLVLYDNTNINEEDVETNFLFSPKDLSHSKAHTLRSKLLEMNPLVSIEIIEELKLDDSKELEKFNIIAISTGSFGEMEKWDQISRKNNVPVYILWCCGLYAFFYACLGNDYKYVKNLKKEKKDEEGNDNGAQEFHVKPLDFKETLQGSNNKRVKDVFWGIKSKFFRY